MDQKEFNSKIQELQSTLLQLDTKANLLLGNDHTLFGKITVPLIGASVNEAAFIRLVSYFYVLYFELGKLSLEFLIKEIISSKINTNFYEDDPRKLVHCFRTFFHHNLDEDNGDDVKKIDSCKSWFNKQINKDYPVNDSEWSIPLKVMLEDGFKFLNDVILSMSHIESLETKEEVLRIWKIKAFNSHSVYNFEVICIEIIPYFGLEGINANDFCKRKIQTWAKELSGLDYGYDFKTEASKLIERDLIKFATEESQKMPITGKDIMEILNIDKADKKVGEILKLCKSKYENSPCSKEELLFFVKENVANKL